MTQIFINQPIELLIRGKILTYQQIAIFQAQRENTGGSQRMVLLARVLEDPHFPSVVDRLDMASDTGCPCLSTSRARILGWATSSHTLLVTESE